MFCFLSQFDISQVHSLIIVLLLLSGVGLLVQGGQSLTKGSVSIASHLRISPLIVGLTVVSLATSMPELFTCIFAVQESADLAIGSIIGSNIANISLIVGISALIVPLKSDSQLVKKELPVMLVMTLFFVFLALGGFSYIEGLILLAAAIAYLYWIVSRAIKSNHNTGKLQISSDNPNILIALVLVFLGGVFLWLGADFLISSARVLALRIGVSEVFVGLSIVALGTSLPELVVSITAILKKEDGLCLGNIVGSNFFNLSLIGGTSALFFPFPVNGSFFKLEFPILIFISALFYFFLRKPDSTIGRNKGIVLLLFYFSLMTFMALK